MLKHKIRVKFKHTLKHGDTRRHRGAEFWINEKWLMSDFKGAEASCDAEKVTELAKHLSSVHSTLPNPAPCLCQIVYDPRCLKTVFLNVGARKTSVPPCLCVMLFVTVI